MESEGMIKAQVAAILQHPGRKALKRPREEDDLVENSSATAAASGGKSQARGKRPCEEDPSSASITAGTIKARVAAILQHPGRQAHVEGKSPCEDPSATAAASGSNIRYRRPRIRDRNGSGLATAAGNPRWQAISKNRWTPRSVRSSAKALGCYYDEDHPLGGRLVRPCEAVIDWGDVRPKTDFKELPHIKATVEKAIAAGYTVEWQSTGYIIK